MTGTHDGDAAPLRSVGPDGGRELRIDDLAREAGTTVRNVRAYQDRGLLAPPRREGRVAWYDEGHLVRLRLIGSMLERGFTLANIAEIVDGWAEGRNLGDLLGLSKGIAGPFSDEVPDRGSPQEIARRYGLEVDDAEAASDALLLGLVEIDGDQLRVPSPRLLRAGLELHDAGIPLPDLFAELRRIRADVEAMAERFVRLVVAHVFEPHLDDGMPDPEKVPELADKMARIRPLATIVVEAELARALQARADAELGARLTTLLARRSGAGGSPAGSGDEAGSAG
ncbi:MAG TPA: MerR family transcriptional regulator [Acidimicrobiales bacterium]|nr:MerR family transcriptional regulator [Acidimicrobiales bacterium]